MKKLSFVITLLIALTACNNSEDKLCKGSFDPSESPYDSPIWHPQINVIGFNHTPIKSVAYRSSGKDCPGEADYYYNEDSTGFWLVNVDGTNKRRVLPYKLLSPVWSSDGKWIAYGAGRLYKMPFDGKNFDTTAIQQLTFEGGNFFPAFSPNGDLIAYDNTDCGSAVSPRLPNSCGILTIKQNGTDKKLVAEGRYPDWISQDTLLYIGLQSELYKISVRDSVVIKITSFNENNKINNYNTSPKFGGQDKIAFISQDNVRGGISLYTLDRNGNDLKKVIANNVTDFSWSPDNRIVYINFDGFNITETGGTLWIMDANGNNLKQLTFNNALKTK